MHEIQQELIKQLIICCCFSILQIWALFSVMAKWPLSPEVMNYYYMVPSHSHLPKQYFQSSKDYYFLVAKTLLGRPHRKPACPMYISLVLKGEQLCEFWFTDSTKKRRPPPKKWMTAPESGSSFSKAITKIDLCTRPVLYIC